MKSFVTPLALAGALWATTVAAEDDCYVPMTNWQPREAVARLAFDNGWTVRRIKIDDGCYELIGFDAEGRAIEVKLNPGTLDVVDMEFESDHGDREDDGKDGHDSRSD